MEVGGKVAISDINSRKNALSESSKKLGEINKDVESFELDIRVQESIKSGIKAVNNVSGTIDILKNNAGLTLKKSTLEMSLKEWQNVIDTNLTGTWLMDKEVVDQMISNNHSRGGRIINIASQLGKAVGHVPDSAYYASKAGIIYLTRVHAMG